MIDEPKALLSNPGVEISRINQSYVFSTFYKLNYRPQFIVFCDQLMIRERQFSACNLYSPLRVIHWEHRKIALCQYPYSLNEKKKQDLSLMTQCDKQKSVRNEELENA